MEATTLFERSWRAFLERRKAMANKLPNRLICTLLRAGYGDPDRSHEIGVIRESDLDRARIRIAVESGEIWSARHIGPQSVKTLCAWLAEPERKEP
jgi:hypothetical protein